MREPVMRTCNEGTSNKRTGNKRTGIERTGNERTGKERAGKEKSGNKAPRIGRGARMEMMKMMIWKKGLWCDLNLNRIQMKDYGCTQNNMPMSYGST